MRHHRSLAFALATALVMGSWPGVADDANKPTLLNAERPYVFQIEAVYAYAETEAKLSSEIGFLVPALGQGQFTTKTLEMSNVGGEVRALGPLMWGVLRPFIEGGAVTAGFENPEGDLSPAKTMVSRASSHKRTRRCSTIGSQTRRWASPCLCPSGNRSLP